MGKIRRFLGFFALLFVALFVGDAWSAGYICPDYKKYNWCNEGFYMVASSDSTACAPTPAVGNACRACPTGQNCIGGTICPTVTITYNLNGGNGTTPDSTSCPAGEPCDLNDGETNSFYRAGYVLVGWSTNKTASTGDFTLAANYTNTHRTVYAVWKPCTGARYKPSTAQAVDACRLCPVATSGWTGGTGTAWTSYTDCYQYINSNSDYCTQGQVRQYAINDSDWDTEVEESTLFKAVPGAYVTGSGASMTCAQCSGAKYSAGGDVHFCTDCPVATSGWTRGTGTGWTSYSQCYETRDATTISSYCSAGQLARNASGPNSWDVNNTRESGAFSARPGSYVTGSGASMTCAQCSGAKYSAGGDVHSCNSCPLTAIDQTGYPWHYSADPGSTAVNDCYVYGDATEFSDYCAAGQWRLYYDSSRGDYTTFTEHSTVTAKPGAYVDDSDHTFPTCTQCTGAKYSAGGDVHSCNSCPTIYTDDTTAGKSVASQCKVATDPGYYIAANNDDKQTQCTTLHYCPSATISYGSHNAPTACPDAETHASTNYPDSYYDPTMTYIEVQSWGGAWKSVDDCRAVYSFTNSRGRFTVESVLYDSETEKYEEWVGTPYYRTINPGYYGYGRYHDAYCDDPTESTYTRLMLYKDAQPCPAGSYCPGLDSMPSCTSGTYNDTLGINACPANYGTSPAMSTSNTQCYLTTTAGKWVATANAAQTDCTAGGFCVGGAKVNYGSTGGRTLCVTGAYSGIGATACIACEDGTTTSGTGQTSCNAECSNATDSKGDAAVKTWAETTWNTNNTVSDLCVAVRCFGGVEGHYLDNGNCPRCDSLANGLYPRSSLGDTSGGPEVCFLYESDIPGQYIATPKATFATDCPLATYQAGSEHAIHYGEISECDTCPDNTYADEAGLAQCKNCLENYTTYGEKSSPSACRIACPAGAYLAAANDTECTDVGVGYWAAQSFVTQGNAGIRNKCASGLTTIGFGAGADEAADCGRVLNIGGEKIYLRSAKKTDLALNVNIGGTTYYGNMSTEDKFMSDGIEKSLKLNVDGTIYSVYDDSGEYYSGGGSSAVSISPNLEATSTVPANYNDDNGLNWSANMPNGVVISGVAGCDSTTAENGDIAASGFTPSGSGNGCYCRITSPGDGGTRWVYATTHNQCSTKCAYMCANNMKGDSSKKITYRTNLYQVAGILGS